MPLTDYARDRWIVPEMSKFTSADLPDMSAVDTEQEHWHANFILNSIFGRPIGSPQRQAMSVFLRRSHAAFGEYAHARAATLEWLANREGVLRYFDAIGHWEAFLSYAWQAYWVLARGQKIWYDKGDGSVLERLHDLHVAVKHVDLLIERGEFIDDALLCVWLTNDGLQSKEKALAYAEVVEILEDLAELANIVQTAGGFAEKLKEVRGASPASTNDS